MCGVFGAVVPFYAPKHDMERWLAAYNRTSSRGRDSRKLYQITRQGVGEINLEDMQLIWKQPLPQVLIGNSRAMPTTEWVDVKDPENVQPFESRSGKWVVTHNGTIANDKELINRYVLDPTSPVDTAVITELLDYFDQLDDEADAYYAFVRTLEVLEGSFALLVADTQNPHRLYWATNYKPLYAWSSRTGGTVVASLQEHLEEPGDLNAPRALPQYSYGWIDTDRIAIKGTLYPPASHTKVLVVCSGGLDSSTVAWHMQKRGCDVTLMHFLYSCKAETREQAAVQALAREMNVPAVYVPLDFLPTFTVSTLTDPTLEIETARDGEAGVELAHEWVPARNLIMLSMAIAYAESNGIHTIALGNNLEEAGAFPDNDEEFINRLNHLIPYAVKPYHSLQIIQPVGHMVKHEIVRLGLDTGMPYELTWSCYEGGREHCGKCGPCLLRRKAFAMNGAFDPAFEGRIDEEGNVVQKKPIAGD